MGYEEQLDRALEGTPDIEGSGARFSLPDPQLRQEGHATVFENFRAVVDTLGRSPDHVMQYLQTELGTSATIDESGRLRLTGDFKADRVAEALSAYADGYVLCPECGLPDTWLESESCATLRRCEACGARSPIES